LQEEVADFAWDKQAPGIISAPSARECGRAFPTAAGSGPGAWGTNKGAPVSKQQRRMSS
jgi:hypothetical protein